MQWPYIILYPIFRFETQAFIRTKTYYTPSLIAITLSYKNEKKRKKKEKWKKPKRNFFNFFLLNTRKDVTYKTTKKDTSITHYLLYKYLSCSQYNTYASYKFDTVYYLQHLH